MPSSQLERKSLECDRVDAVDLRGVGYQYSASITALRDITLQVAPGEKIALLGANACGKSTLLRLMNGLIHPSSGSVRVFGEEITVRALRDPAFAHRLRRRVGFIFQNSDAQLFSSTVREEIAFGPLQMGLEPGEARQRIADVAAMMDISGLLDRAPFHLSGGEKKRVALASVLAVNPDVLLLDEPTNGLDPRSQRWVVDLVAKLHAAGKTVITATHDLGIVHEIADRAVVLSEDHTVAGNGSTRDILSNLDLLLSVNLIHEHAHRHGNLIHSHPHHHGGDHDHTHDHPEL